jgi:hypothetical protein
MQIGIMSDTHNDTEATKRAIAIFQSRGIKILIHAGDFTSPRMLHYLKDFESYIVLGNGDLIDSEEIDVKANELGMKSVDLKSEFDLAGKKFLVFHGHDVPMYRDAVASGKYDYIIKGHTHHFENYVSNECRIINPGAVYGHDESSIAVLDVETGKVEKIDLEEM